MPFLAKGSDGLTCTVLVEACAECADLNWAGRIGPTDACPPSGMGACEAGLGAPVLLEISKRCTDEETES